MRACLDKEFPNHGLTAKEERDYVVALTMFENDFDTNLYCKDATPRTKRLVIALIRAAYEDHGHVAAYQTQTYVEMLKLEMEGKEWEPFHKELMAKEAWRKHYEEWKMNKLLTG